MTRNRFSKKRKAYIGLMKALMWLSAALTAALVLFMIGYVLARGLPNVSWQLLSTKPSYLRNEIGILPDILNTALYRPGDARYRSAAGRGRGGLSDGIRFQQAACRRD